MIQKSRRGFNPLVWRNTSNNGSVFAKPAYKKKRTNNDLLTTELLNCPERHLGPEDKLQIYILPYSPLSGGYYHVTTVIYAFFSLLVCTTCDSHYSNSGGTHNYGYNLKTYIRTYNKDYRPKLNAQTTHEVATVQGNELKHATMKHTQYNIFAERNHASVKTHLKLQRDNLEIIGIKFSL